MSNRHPNGYTKEMIKEILGTSWPTMPEDHETGNQLRRRKGREMREGKRPIPHTLQRRWDQTLMRMESISIQKDQGLIIWIT